MNESPPNLLNSLFEFHPREGHTPKENFLSEAFAYVRMTCDAARDEWMSLALRRRVRLSQCEVTTRQTERSEEDAAIFPDMRMTGVFDTGEPFDLISEHKWDSGCDAGQLRKYLKLVDLRGSHCELAFVGATHRQKKEATNADPRMHGKAFLWADIFQAFEPLPKKPDILVQFLDFMKTHGLSPGRPIDSATMLAFVKSSGFESALEHCANKLNDDFEWDFIPKRFRSAASRDITNRWGRIAIEFPTPGWKPTITIGFLIDERNHKVPFLNRQTGIDLLLRIEADPRDQKNIAPVLALLDRQRTKLSRVASSVLLLRDRGNGNTHSLLIMRSCLGDMIEKANSQQEQLEAIHNTLSSWGKTLFGDGTLEKAFKRAGLDSGM